MSSEKPYEIERGVPVPPTRRGGGSVWPWEKMEDGDSVLVDEEDRGRAQSSASAWLKRHRPGWKAISRKVGGGKGRVWLVDEGEEPEQVDEAAPDTPDIESAVEDVEPPA